MADSTRDWSALPRDVLFAVFLKLGPREITLGAEFACTAWRRVAVEEPALWRRVGFETIDEQWRWIGDEAETVTERLAMERSAGQCEAFRRNLDYEDLPDLVQRAPSLKILDITCFSNYAGTAELVVALRKLPLLECLQIYFTHPTEPADETFRSVCQACPNLKKLMLMFAGPLQLEYNEDEFSMEPVDGEIPLMRELRTIDLCECDLSANGLKGILDSCPLLESLHVTGYFNKRDIDEELRVKCARVKKLILPTALSPSDRRYYEFFGDDDDSEED